MFFKRKLQPSMRQVISSSLSTLLYIDCKDNICNKKVAITGTISYVSPNFSWRRSAYLYAPPPVTLIFFSFITSADATKFCCKKSRQVSIYFVSNFTKWRRSPWETSYFGFTSWPWRPIRELGFKLLLFCKYWHLHTYFTVKSFLVFVV